MLPVGSATAHDGWRPRGQPSALLHPVARTSRLWGLGTSLLGAGLGGNDLLVPWRCTTGAVARYYAACDVLAAVHLAESLTSCRGIDCHAILKRARGVLAA